MRKPYPDRDERIGMADKKIDQLEKLIAERRELIAQTEKKLEERKTALERSEKQLASVSARRERLIAAKERVGSGDANKTPSSEKAKMAQLMKLMAQQGKTIEDLINSLK